MCIAGLRQQQRVPKLGLERANLGGEMASQLFIRRLLFRRTRRASASNVVDDVFIGCLGNPPPPAGDDAAAIDRLVPRDCQQPGFEAGVAAEACQPLIRHQECFLRGVFSIGVRCERGARGTIYRHAMSIDELPKGRRIALERACHQVSIAHTNCRHTRGARGWVKEGRWGG